MVTCITCICSLDTPSDEVGVGSQPENLCIVLWQGVFVTRRVWVLQIQLWDLIVKRLPRQWKAVSPRRRGRATSSRGSSRSLHCERRGSSRWSSASRAETTSWTHSSVSSRGSSCASSSKKTQSIKMTRLVLWKCDGRCCQYNADQINRFSAPAVGRWPSCSAVHSPEVSENSRSREFSTRVSFIFLARPREMIFWSLDLVSKHESNKMESRSRLEIREWSYDNLDLVSPGESKKNNSQSRLEKLHLLSRVRVRF